MTKIAVNFIDKNDYCIWETDLSHNKICFIKRIILSKGYGWMKTGVLLYRNVKDDNFEIESGIYLFNTIEDAMKKYFHLFLQ